jgi:hypothetical protein
MAKLRVKKIGNLMFETLVSALGDPDFDSGWVEIPASGSHDFEHNLADLYYLAYFSGDIGEGNFAIASWGENVISVNNELGIPLTLRLRLWKWFIVEPK